jgi:diguanylate cyclase (GGDEF)-like protein
MTRGTFSIRARLTLFILGFVAIVFGVAASAILNLKSADARTDEIADKWLTGTAQLAEIGDLLGEYRIAEGYRALAQTPQARAEAEGLAEEHRRAIHDLQARYLALLGDRIQRADVEAFRSAWKAYYTEHDAWVRADAQGAPGDSGRHDNSLRLLYKAADQAVDRLIAANMAAAHAQAVAIDRLTDRSINVAIAVFAIAIVFAIWLLIRVRSEITGPLEAITRALSKLAAGNREIRVPELHRDDEIGTMAAAFEIFRANALALEQAHEATRAAQEQADSLARHDPLTGLSNRRVFCVELQTALGCVQDGAAPYWVLLIGLDQFKQVNDRLGHPTGDLVLCEIARRLGEVARSEDTLARLRGDEFAIISPGDAEPQRHLDRGQYLASRLLAAIRQPILAGEATLELGASIGMASCEADSGDAESVLHAADIALYRAKRDGRGTFRLFEQNMAEELRAQASIETDLKRAVAEGKIRPHYQPLVELKRNRVCEFEALARWEHPERGFVPPDVFIPLIEQLGLSARLTELILRQVCRDAKHWPEYIRIAINISPSELRDPLLPDRLLAILSEERFAADRLEIEIIETALVNDIETAKSVLLALRAAGITIALDDFGIGYSNLYHLRELKFDKIKIDRSFVQSMQSNPESEKIVDAILDLTRRLNLPTVAEGIENTAVLLRLAAKGCELGQGYYFGKAMPADRVRDLLLEGTLSKRGITATHRAA